MVLIFRFFTKPQAKPGVLLITIEQEDPALSSSSSDEKVKNSTPSRSVFRLIPDEFTEDAVRDIIQKVVSYYETPPISQTDLNDSSNNDDNNEYLCNVPAMIDYRLAFHIGEYEAFLSASSYQIL